MDKINSLKSSRPILGQLLSYIPRELFKNSVDQYKSDKWYSTVKTWDQFVFILYGVLTGSSSIREIIKNFTLLGHKLKHCGVFAVPRRSSISDANANRSSNVFGHFYLSLYNHYKEYLSDSYLPYKVNGEVDPGKVEIFDSTTVSLFKDVFKGCGRIPLDGRKKGGIKAFSKITLAERVPNFINLKSAATNEKVFLSYLDLSKGTIAVFDKGFQKFSQYDQWSANGIYYVTRMNKNANFKVISQRKIENATEYGVMMDADIELEYTDPQDKSKKLTTNARMVAYLDPQTNKSYVFLSNLFTLKAFTICLLYRNRWTIEPLFRQIKQNFELTYFLSDSEEGIKTQIWIAMVLNLIFTVIHKKIKEAEDFTTMVRIAAKNTASYISLEKFLKIANNELNELLTEIRNVQLELFPERKRADFQNST